jgi:hypothetical protein
VQIHDEWGLLLAYIADCLAATLRSGSFGSLKSGMVLEYLIIVEYKCSEREDGSESSMTFSLAYIMLHLANHNR